MKKVFFSGAMLGYGGPSIVNRAYVERSSEWLYPYPEAPSVAALMNFARHHRSYEAVLVSSLSRLNVLLLLLARVLRVPGWYLAHGSGKDEMVVNGRWSTTKYLVEVATIGAASGVVAVSEVLRQQLQGRFRRLADRICVVANGTDAPPEGSFRGARSRGGRERIKLLSVGTYPIKNVRVLVQALESLGRQDWELTLVGPKTVDVDEVAHLPRVSHLEGLSHDEVLELMRSCDLYVQISILEPFGLAICEAAEAGCELLVSGVSGCLPVLTNMGEDHVVLDHQDVKGIAKQLAVLMDRVRRGGAEEHGCLRSWDVAAGELRTLVLS